MKVKLTTAFSGNDYPQRHTTQRHATHQLYSCLMLSTRFAFEVCRGRPPQGVGRAWSQGVEWE